MKKKIDRRIEKSQNAIHAAFMEILLRMGFDAVTVKDITERANISRKTFYLHYVDKYDLLNSIVSKHIEELTIICEEKKEKGLIEGTIIWFKYFEKHKIFFAILFATESTVSFRYQLLDFIMNQLAVKFRDISSEVEQEILKKFTGMAILGIVESFVLDQLDADVEQTATKVGELLSLIIMKTLQLSVK
jgi:AcrR family transcriptional regulator